MNSPNDRPANATLRVAARSNSLLLVEPAFMQRRTVTMVARDLGLADIHEASGYDVAERMLAEQEFGGLLVALTDEELAMNFLRRVREGLTRCTSAVLIIVITEECNPDKLERLRDLGIKRVIIKPFKVKTVLEAISTLTQ